MSKKKSIFSRVFTIVAFLAISTPLLALSPKSIFQNDYLMVEKVILKNYLQSFSSNAKPNLSTPLTNTIFSDPHNIIHRDFEIPAHFRDAVRFWFFIYTQYSSHQVVIHDKKELSLTYDFLDFTELSISPLNPLVKSRIQTKFAYQKIGIIRKSLNLLAKNPYTKNKTAIKIRRTIKLSNAKMPRSRRHLRKFYRKRASNLRMQTGQRDMIFQGILNSLPYIKFLDHYLVLFKLPPELLAIPFLESSFNPEAFSKVGASGIWQIMPRIARKLLPYDKWTDGRSSIALSSIGAFHLLRQNHQILKRWDLAVTAYNSGTKHLLRARKKLRRKFNPLTLELIFQNYKHPHLGFASKNFYAEFLALIYTLTYRNLIFPLKGSTVSAISDNQLKLYISLCGITPIAFINKYKAISPRILQYNDHLRYRKRKYPKGTVIISDQPLPKKEFYNLSDFQITKNFPRKWSRIVKHYNCSIK